jgi:uncharacterized protein (DUF58 family)
MSFPARANRPRRSLSWLGLAFILGGLTLIWLYFDHPHLSTNPNPVYALAYLGTGCVLILWGLRALAGEISGLFGKLRNRPARRYRVSMPREAVIYGLILLVLCAGALLGRSNMLMLVFGLMAGPFILNGQVTLGILKRLDVQRSLPEHATVGENFSVKLSLSNRKHLLSSWMVSAEDFVQTPFEQLQPVVLFACVPAQSTRQAVYEIRPAYRGLHEFGPVRVMSRFPLGLMERSIDLGLVEKFVVYPRIGRLKPRWRQSSARGELASEHARASLGASDDEFHRLREYRRGDNPRAIHWRTTARRNELMVKEFQNGHSQDLLLAIDLWLPGLSSQTRAEQTQAEQTQAEQTQAEQTRGQHTRAPVTRGQSIRAQLAGTRSTNFERVELAVSFAASICVDHMQSATDSTVELVISGRQTQRASAGSGIASMSGLLERLALAQAGAADGLAQAICAAADSAPGRLRQVLITTRPRAALKTALAAQNDSNEPLDVSEFEIIEADPQELMAWLEFDLSNSEAAT